MTTDAGQRDAPAETVTADQVVAANIRHWRRAAGLTQEELGQRLGWSAANVSAAERSADGDRDRRRFDAQTLAELALALGVPLSALFLPPPDDGLRARYLLSAAGAEHGMRDLMRLAIPDSDDETPVMDAYRARWNEAGARYFGDDPDWMRLVARWVGNVADRRLEVSARLRGHRDALMRAAAEYGTLADEIDGGGR